MTEACAGRIKNFKVLEYICVTSQTRYARATGAQQTFNTRLTRAWDTLLKQYLIKSERACSVHWRASNVRRTRSKRIQRACNARGTYSKRIRHTPGTLLASTKFLSMFKFFLIPNAHETRDDFSDVQRRAPDVHQTYKARVQRASYVSPTCSWRMLNFTFLSTRPARV